MDNTFWFVALILGIVYASSIQNINIITVDGNVTDVDEEKSVVLMKLDLQEEG